jgi:hypothetical protein
MKSLAGVAQAEGHVGEHEEAKGSADGVAGMDGNLIVCLHQIGLKEEVTTRELVGVLMYVTDGIAVGTGLDIQHSTVSAWTPTIVLLWYDM